MTDQTLKKVRKLVSYLNGDLWPYGSGRFPDSERYQLEHAKKIAASIRQDLQALEREGGHGADGAFVYRDHV